MTHDKKEALKKAMSKIKLVRVLQLAIKDKNEYKNAVEALRTDKYLLEAGQGDQDFQDQLKVTMPSAYYMLNRLLEDVDPKYKIKFNKPNAFKKSNHQMIYEFKNSIKVKSDEITKLFITQ